MGRKGNYDRFPALPLPCGRSGNLWIGYSAILRQLANQLNRNGATGRILVVDTYPGVDDREVLGPLSEGLLVVYGVSAALITKGDVLVYADLARWEIQRRLRRGMGNWGAENKEEDFFRRYKRAFFVEWHVADRHKFAVFDEIDLFLDTHHPDEPKLLAAEALQEGLRLATADRSGSSLSSTLRPGMVNG